MISGSPGNMPMTEGIFFTASAEWRMPPPNLKTFIPLKSLMPQAKIIHLRNCSGNRKLENRGTYQIIRSHPAGAAND
jgi:hypothetical protein